jgi:hypothetical protein
VIHARRFWHSPRLPFLFFNKFGQVDSRNGNPSSWNREYRHACPLHLPRACGFAEFSVNKNELRLLQKGKAASG